MVGAFLRIGIEEREEEDFMEIRKATIDDLALVSAVEAECFPPAEAATKDSFRGSLITAIISGSSLKREN